MTLFGNMMGGRLGWFGQRKPITRIFVNLKTHIQANTQVKPNGTGVSLWQGKQEIHTDLYQGCESSKPPCIPHRHTIFSRAHPRTGVSFWQGKQGIHTSPYYECESKPPTPTTGTPFRRTIFSGIQPTGVVHIGNYLGAVRQWVDLQKGNDELIFCVVDMHAMTVPYDHTILPESTRLTAASLLACGIDPSRSILYQQSRVIEHAQLLWVLTCLTSMARLSHLPQYKEKSDKLREVPLGLYVYPVLQAADILLYKATHVPVGEDQMPHIDLASHIARVFNNKYGKTFIRPKCLIAKSTAARIQSLRKPEKKMSKSEPDPRSRIDLTDTPDVIREKFKKAVTDNTSAVYYDPDNRPGVSNLMDIHSEITGLSHQQITQESTGIETAQYKMVVADAVIELVNPIRQQIEALMADPQHLTNIMESGVERARQKAQPVWQEVRSKVGLSHEI